VTIGTPLLKRCGVTISSLNGPRGRPETAAARRFFSLVSLQLLQTCDTLTTLCSLTLFGSMVRSTLWSLLGGGFGGATVLGFSVALWSPPLLIAFGSLASLVSLVTPALGLSLPLLTSWIRISDSLLMTMALVGSSDEAFQDRFCSGGRPCSIWRRLDRHGALHPLGYHHPPGSGPVGQIWECRNPHRH